MKNEKSEVSNEIISCCFLTGPVSAKIAVYRIFVIYLVTPTMMMIVDDHVAHQTLTVSIKKPISVVRTFCRRALNEFTEVASSKVCTLASSRFHLFTTLSEKK